MTPTQRTLKAMREQGRLCGIVEKFQQYGGKFGVRQDLFGFIDIIAIDPTEGIVAIQSCGQDYSGHVKKLTEERNEAVFEWLKHAPCELWSWSRRKYRLSNGSWSKGYRWKPRIADLRIINDDITVIERK
jgi:hypothetical protein